MAMDTRVREAIAKRGIQGAQITILDALLRMRQVCCDPALLKDGGGTSDSAKRERLLDMLESLIQERRKVLVFSQFVQMLRLIETDVTARGWSHEWLSGETVDRDGAVTRFQEGSAQIFLISLKAGGVGLTLTAADTVILYDPWWNPAVERQAMDRAHRIGQSKAVFVYRLVAEGTVEEAILGLQARKQALADALFEGRTTEGFAFDHDAITDLFQPLIGAVEGR
jgi:SNF2 family DNA or RNA helicase